MEQSSFTGGSTFDWMGSRNYKTASFHLSSKMSKNYKHGYQFYRESLLSICFFRFRGPYPISHIPYPISHTPHIISHIPYPIPHIQNPTSHIPYILSLISYPLSLIPYMKVLPKASVEVNKDRHKQFIELLRN